MHSSFFVLLPINSGAAKFQSTAKFQSAAEFGFSFRKLRCEDVRCGYTSGGYTERGAVPYKLVKADASRQA